MHVLCPFGTADVVWGCPVPMKQHLPVYMHGLSYPAKARVSTIHIHLIVQNLSDWKGKFNSKYPIVGTIVSSSGKPKAT